MLILFGDKTRSQTKPFLYLFQLVAAKAPVHERPLTNTRHIVLVEVNTAEGGATVHTDVPAEARVSGVTLAGPVVVNYTTTLAVQGPPIKSTHLGIALGAITYCGSGNINKEHPQLCSCWQACWRGKALAICIGLRPGTTIYIWFYKGGWCRQYVRHKFRGCYRGNKRQPIHYRWIGQGDVPPPVLDVIFTATWPLAFTVVAVLAAGMIVGVKAGVVVTP